MGILTKGKVMFTWSICCLLGGLTVSPEAVEFLGERSEPEIHTGCVVYGGEYLPPPYVVKRMGNEVFINEMSVRWFVPWPIPKNLGWGRTKVMPAIPDDINEDSSEWDESVGKFCWGILDHLIYLGVTNRAERYAAEVKKLPCVISACVRGDGKVVIDWKKGTKGVGTNVYPDRYSRGSKKWPQDKKTLQELGDCEVAKLAAALRRDSFLLLPGGDCQVTVSGVGVDRDVYHAIGMCDQGLPADEICNKLGGRSEFPLEVCEALVRHRSSFDDSYFAWAKRKVVAEIERLRKLSMAARQPETGTTRH